MLQALSFNSAKRTPAEGHPVLAFKNEIILG